MTVAGAGSYSLLIPTYNRPSELGRLLRFLERQRANFPVLVLDSSQPEARTRNRERIAVSKLNLRHLEYDAAIQPFEKFWRGAKEVETEYSSLCADDDLLLVDSLQPLIGCLAADPSCSVAHGWYFTFRLTQIFELTGIAYRGASITDVDPLDRVYRLMRRYEALTYGVFRTQLLRETLGHLQFVQTNMARELLGSVLAAISGSATRLPLLYYGRSMGPSLYVSDWHPVDYLISSPERLFTEYARYRKVVFEYLHGCAGSISDPDEVLRRLDQIHWRYAADYLKPGVLDYLVRKLQAGASRQEMMDGMWSELLAPDEDRSTFARLRAGATRPFRRMGRWFRSEVSRADEPRGDISRRAADGTLRTYRLHTEFLTAVDRGSPIRGAETALLEALDDFA